MVASLTMVKRPLMVAAGEVSWSTCTPVAAPE